MRLGFLWVVAALLLPIFASASADGAAPGAKEEEEEWSGNWPGAKRGCPRCSWRCSASGQVSAGLGGHRVLIPCEQRGTGRAADLILLLPAAAAHPDHPSTRMVPGMRVQL